MLLEKSSHSNFTRFSHSFASSRLIPSALALIFGLNLNPSPTTYNDNVFMTADPNAVFIAKSADRFRNNVKF